MPDCSKIVAILTLDGGTYEASSSASYGDNVPAEYRGATFKTSSHSYSGSPTLTTFCEDPTPNVGEIMGVRLRSRSGYSGTESGQYPNKPEWDYSRKTGEIFTDEMEFLIINTRSGPDYWLLGVEPRVEVTPLATTKPGIQDRDFRVWIGDRKGIEQWVRLNSLVIDQTQEFENFSGGRSRNSVYQYQGWRIACQFPYEALLKYPFCGGVVQGREVEGPQFINLCSNSLGVCEEKCKCDCCDIGRRVLEAFGVDW